MRIMLHHTPQDEVAELAITVPGGSRREALAGIRYACTDGGESWTLPDGTRIDLFYHDDAALAPRPPARDTVEAMEEVGGFWVPAAGQ